MLKGEIAYSPVVGKAVIHAFSATAQPTATFFPEGSEDPAPQQRLAEDLGGLAGFQAELGKFQDAAAGRSSLGPGRPADKAAFNAAVEPIFGNCKTCHEAYRVEN